MGNTLNSKYSQKTLNSKKIKGPFKDFAAVEQSISDGRSAESESKLKLRQSRGKPGSRDIIIHYETHSESYNRHTKIVNWTMELITIDNFKYDDFIPYDSRLWEAEWNPNITSQKHELGDYNSPFYNEMASRDLHSSKGLYEPINYVSNLIPGNRSILWRELGQYTEILIKDFSMKKVWVCSGPIFTPVSEMENSKKYINYVTTNSQIAVPNYLFKVFLAEKRGALYLDCFKITNVAKMVLKKQKKKKEMWSHLVALDEIEEEIGFRLFPDLDRKAKNLFGLYPYVTKRAHMLYESFPKTKFDPLLVREKVRNRYFQYKNYLETTPYFEEFDPHRREMAAYMQKLDEHSVSLEKHESKLKEQNHKLGLHTGMLKRQKRKLKTYNDLLDSGVTTGSSEEKSPPSEEKSPVGTSSGDESPETPSGAEKLPVMTTGGDESVPSSTEVTEISTLDQPVQPTTLASTQPASQPIVQPTTVSSTQQTDQTEKSTIEPIDKSSISTHVPSTSSTNYVLLKIGDKTIDQPPPPSLSSSIEATDNPSSQSLSLIRPEQLARLETMAKSKV